VPWLPEAIWRRRLESEYALLRESGVVFTTNADKTVYEVVLNKAGLEKIGSLVRKRGSHKIRISLGREFPYAGGIEVTWLTPIFHPNIRPADGRVCIQLVNQWAEGQTVKQVVEALEHLLENPNPASPLNHEAAVYFKENTEFLAGEPPALKRPRIIV